MVRYELYEIARAIKAHNGTYESRERSPERFRSSSRKWDYVIRVVCNGCGRTLSQHEVRNGLAYCFSCRKVLFPETIPSYEPARRSYPYPRSRGHPW